MPDRKTLLPDAPCLVTTTQVLASYCVQDNPSTIIKYLKRAKTWQLVPEAERVLHGHQTEVLPFELSRSLAWKNYRADHADLNLSLITKILI